MCGNITEELMKDVSNRVAFTLQLDESTDFRETVQLLVFIRAKSIIGQVNGLIALCRQHDDFPDFLLYHCIIHQ
jgi:hypothetical protein